MEILDQLDMHDHNLIKYRNKGNLFSEVLRNLGYLPSLGLSLRGVV